MRDDGSESAVPPDDEGRTMADRRAAAETLRHHSVLHGSGLRVRCPHCQNPIELLPDAALESIRCGSCGSSFGLVSDGAEPDAAEASRPAIEVAHFRLIERLGMGAFGTVWRAHDAKLDRMVAVKIPRTRRLARREQEQFLHEARAAARLRHPHIVPVYEAGRDGDTLYIASELVQGTTLAQWLDAGAVTPREAAALAAQIARALDHAHDEGVIHRDLKPANVMLDAAGEPHLMDFGLARREANEITMTLEGQVLGTPAYMSPEQAQGDSHHADRRSDVYSLGVMLYQMLTGELPFRGNARMMMHQAIHYEPLSPRKMYAAVPRDLDTLVMRCLEKSPARRFATAGDLADELERYLQGEPIVSRPISTAERAWRWCRRKPVAAALAASLTALVLLLAGAGPVVALREAALRRSAEQSAAAAQEANARTETAFAALKDESAKILFMHGAAEYAAGRQAAGCEEIFRAWAMCAPDNPLRPAYGRVLVDRLTRGGQSTVVLHHDDDVGPVAFSPDGARVVTGGYDNAARLWDAATGRPVAKPMLHESTPDAGDVPRGLRRQPSEGAHLRRYVRHAAFAADGKHVLTAAFYGPIQRWDAATGEAAGTAIRPQWLSKAAFSPDGRRAISGAIRTAQLWDATSGAKVGPPLEHESVLAAVAFSPDGRRVATGSWDKTARLWDAASGAPVGKPMTHDTSVNRVLFSPDGRRLASQTDKSVHVWDAATGDPVGQPYRGEQIIWAMAFGADSRRLAVAEEAVARLWDPSTGKTLGAPLTHEGRIRSIAFTPDGRRVVTAAKDRTVRVWDAESGEPAGAPLRHEGPVYAVTVDAAGRRMASGAWDQTARIWEFEPGLARTTHRGPAGPLGSDVAAAALAPDGRLGGIARDGTVALWNPTTGEASGEPLHRPDSDVKGNDRGQAAFSGDGRRFAATRYGAVRVLEVDAAQPAAPLVIEGTTFAFSADGRRLVAATGSTATVWDVATSQPLGAPLTVNGGVRAVALSPDGARIVFGAGRDGARLVDAATGQSIGEPMFHEESVDAVAFSPDGKRVLTGSYDRTARLWDAATQQPIGETMLHANPVSAAAFSPDGARVLTQSLGGDLRLWDAATGQPLGQPFDRAGFVPAMFSGDGDHLVSLTDRGEAVTIDVASPPTPRDAQAWFELLMGKRLDASGALQRMTADEFAARWQTLEQDSQWHERLRAWQNRGVE